MTESEAPQNLLQWERSPEYRRIFSNHFNFRFAPGDGNITFSQTTEPPGASPQNVILEHINITMSWPHLKMLGEYLSMAVEAVEQEVGPIVSIGISREELRKQAAAIVSDFVMQKK